LAVYRLSLSAWLLGGGTAGSHWCHSPVNLPDRRTIGPHVVVRKLSVIHTAAACDIIQDQVWWMHTQTVHVTKNMHTCMLNVEIQTMETACQRHFFLLKNTQVPWDTQNDSQWTVHHGLDNPLAVHPSTLNPKKEKNWKENYCRASACQSTRTYLFICTHKKQPKRKGRFVHTSRL